MRQTKPYIKTKFETGDIPTQQDYEDLIDSSYNDTDPFDNKYYVKTTGNDSTAKVNDPTLPYLTIKAAALAAYIDAVTDGTNNWNQVYVFEGVYNEFDIGQPEIEMFFEEWAIVWHADSGIITDHEISNKEGNWYIKGRGEFVVTNGNKAISFSYPDTIVHSCEGKAVGNIRVPNDVHTGIGTKTSIKGFQVYGNSAPQENVESLLYEDCTFDQPYTLLFRGANTTITFRRCTLNIDAFYATNKTRDILDKADNIITTILLNKQFNDSTPLDVSALTYQQVIDSLIEVNWPDGGATAAFQIDSNSYTGGSDYWIKSKIIFEDCSFIVHSEKYLPFRVSQFRENISTYIKLTGCRFINKSGVGGQSGWALFNNGLQTFNKNVTIEIDGLVYSGIDNEYASSSINTPFGTHQIENKLDLLTATDQVVVSNVEFQKQASAIGGFGKSAAFAEAIKSDAQYYFPDYTQTGQLNFTKDGSVVDNEGYGNGSHGIIIANGNAWQFTDDFDIMPDSVDVDDNPVTPTAGKRYSFTSIWRGLKFTVGYREINTQAALLDPIFRLPLNLANTDALNYGDNVLLATDVEGANDFSALLADSPTLELDTGEDYVDFGAGAKELKGVLNQSFFNVPFSVMTILKPLDGNPASIEAFWGALDTGIDTGTYAFIRNDGRVSVAYAVNNTKVIVDTLSAVFINGVNPETNIIYTISDANGILIYINGVAVPTGAPALGALMSFYNLNLDYRIGAYTSDSVRTLPYSGKQRETHVYDVELTPEQITVINNSY